MNAIFIMVALATILGVSLGLFGYVRLIRLHKLVIISNKPIDTDSLDAIYLGTIVAGLILTVLCGRLTVGTWQTPEAKYENCINKTKDTEYCSRYLKD